MLQTRESNLILAEPNIFSVVLRRYDSIFILSDSCGKNELYSRSKHFHIPEKSRDIWHEPFIQYWLFDSFHLAA